MSVSYVQITFVTRNLNRCNKKSSLTKIIRHWKPNKNHRLIALENLTKKSWINRTDTLYTSKQNHANKISKEKLNISKLCIVSVSSDSTTSSNQ